MSVWIAYARHVRQSMGRKKPIRLLVITRKVYKCQLRSFRLNLFSNNAKLGDRLAAKRSTKMP